MTVMSNAKKILLLSLIIGGLLSIVACGGSSSTTSNNLPIAVVAIPIQSAVELCRTKLATSIISYPAIKGIVGYLQVNTLPIFNQPLPASCDQFVTYSATDLPSNLNIDPKTGLILGIPLTVFKGVFTVSLNFPALSPTLNITTDVSVDIQALTAPTVQQYNFGTVVITGLSEVNDFKPCDMTNIADNTFVFSCKNMNNISLLSLSFADDITGKVSYQYIDNYESRTYNNYYIQEYPTINRIERKIFFNNMSLNLAGSTGSNLPVSNKIILNGFLTY